MSELYQQLTATERLLITISIMSATLIQLLDTTIVNVALPHMQGALGTTPDQISWVLTSYLVASGVMMPLTGYFTDRLGRKKYLLICIAGFTLISALCGAAESLNEMVLFRLLQGVFGAALVPLSQAILADIYPPEELGKAMALWGLGVMVGPILGPTLGGYLTDVANWRWTFYVNVPIGTMAFLLAWRVVPDTLKKARKMDWVGFILIAAAISLSQYVLDRGNQQDWFDASNITIATVISVLSFMGFIFYNLSSRTVRVFDVHIFKDINFSLANLFMVVLGVGLYGSMVILPLLLENSLNYPVLTTGLVMVPRGISTMFSMILVGKIINKVDPRALIFTGIVFSAFGTWVGTHYSLNINSWWVVWPLLFQGFGLGMIFVPLSVLAFSTLPSASRGEAAGIFSLLRTIGSSIGISVTLTIFTRHNQTA